MCIMKMRMMIRIFRKTSNERNISNVIKNGALHPPLSQIEWNRDATRPKALAMWYFNHEVLFFPEGGTAVR